jgi:repressor LexA|tara:strand:+ start:2657 stop:2866 length:210 start_codon:yes stop_codon:yes gene_type:complete
VKEITTRQAEVLRRIKYCIKRDGYAPGHADLCEYFGFKSANASSSHIKALIRKGYISTGRYGHKTKVIK